MENCSKQIIRLGLERILTEEIGRIKNLRVGLICNQASVNHEFRHAADLFFENENIDLRTLFGPQHGIRGDVQDNMIETLHTIDSATNLPIYSLYSETREPTEEMLKEVDALCFDLQDIGCRVYTFIYTMANAMIACAKYKKKFIVLDRPNPINGIDLEGNVLEAGHESFVGQYQIPMRHAMTAGELAGFFNHYLKINADLEIVTMDGWQRQLYYDETDAPWVMPSPNMPTVETAVVFPATVYFEGTKISEGRGTTRPFEIVGAPFVDAPRTADDLNGLKLPGVIFRSINFLTTFQKHAGTTSGGIFLHVTNRDLFEPVITGVALVRHFYQTYTEKFEWKEPPYEYVYDRNPFDVIAGSLITRRQIEANESLASISKSWKDDLLKFAEIRKDYLLY